MDDDAPNPFDAPSSLSIARRDFVMGGVAFPLLAGCVSLPAERSVSTVLSSQKQEPLREFDVAIVGGSFAGLSAAYQLVRASRTVAIFDTGMPRNRFAEAAHGVIGHDGSSPLLIRDVAKQQLSAYPTTSFVDAQVTRVEALGAGFRVTTDGELTFKAKKVILAYGLQDILPDRPGFREGWGRSVLQCPYCHGYEVRKQRFALLYTSEASLHQIRIMPDWSDDIVFLGDGNRIPQDALDEMRSRNIRYEPRRLKALDVEGTKLRSIVFEDGDPVQRDAVFLITNHKPSTDIAQQLGCTMEEGPFGQYIGTDNLQETDVPGVYAAGDVARPIHNLTWAASDGVSAGIFAHQSLLVHQNPYHKG
ncbi:MAG: NAD(P)/FAD-dependent oxidoreductase [Myxococcota bacterium]